MMTTSDDALSSVRGRPSLSPSSDSCPVVKLNAAKRSCAGAAEAEAPWRGAKVSTSAGRTCAQEGGRTSERV